MKVVVAESCLTLCDPVHHRPPGSSVLGLLQARILKRVPFPSPGDLPNPGIKPRSPALQADSLPSQPLGKSKVAQGLKNRLPVQETRVRPLIREDLTCPKQLSCVPQLWSLCSGAQLLRPKLPRPQPTEREVTTLRGQHTATQSSPCLPAREKPVQH